MHKHFDQNLNLKEIILKERPRHIVECGADEGKNTRLLAGLKNVYPFKLTVISDNLLSPIELGPDVEFIRGISYEEIKKMDDLSVDMFIVDTDHNYWTLAQELNFIDLKLRKDGLIVLHDVSTFYHDTGVAMRYSNGKEYPIDDIEELGKLKGGIGNTVIDFLHCYPFRYRLVRFIEESHGAAVMRKVEVSRVNYLRAVEKNDEKEVLAVSI